ncbi:MAG: histidine kinase [Bifidobacteriaceae bacterium]|nr:histidine kinase [Bifidobacteriaceae bacterium]
MTIRIVTRIRIIAKLLIFVVTCLVLFPYNVFVPHEDQVLAIFLTGTALSCINELTYLTKYENIATIIALIASYFFPHVLLIIPMLAVDAGRLSEHDISTEILTNPKISLQTNNIQYLKQHLYANRRAFITMCCVIIGLLLQYTPHSKVYFIPASLHVDNIAIIILLSCIGIILGFFTDVLTLFIKKITLVTDIHRIEKHEFRTNLEDITTFQHQKIHEATLAERTRIARDIHDNVGHIITRAIMQSQAATAISKATNSSHMERQLDDLNSTLHDAMTTIRSSVHDLEDQGMDFESYISEITQTFSMSEWNIILDNNIKNIPASVARCFSQIINESLTNVRRHSNADTVHITLRENNINWQLVVQDNGKQTKPVSGFADRGMGINNIEQRARDLQGYANCGPYANGWRVLVSIPKNINKS